jgi:hypothetical protein
MYRFLPDYISESILKIDYDTLYDMGYKGLCFDIDNTITQLHTTDVNDETVTLIKALKEKGFRICILSNAVRRRAAEVASKLDVGYVHMAFKPLKKGYIRAMGLLGLPYSSCVMIGDQLFTDIKGGRKAGFLTILTSILNNKEAANIRFRRIFERMIIKKHEREIKTI